MALSVDVQIALDEDSGIAIPNKDQIQQWANQAVVNARKKNLENARMTVRIVNEDEITELNSVYRHKNKVTNVLSFPFVLPPGIPGEELLNTLGDIAVCAAVVNREAEEQNKVLTAHWAHMIVHGTLHLLGYDHQVEHDAQEMEGLEIAILAELGFENPYQ